MASVAYENLDLPAQLALTMLCLTMDPIIASGLISLGREVLPKITHLATNMVGEQKTFSQSLSQAQRTSSQTTSYAPSPAEWAAQKEQVMNTLRNDPNLLSQFQDADWSVASVSYDDVNGIAYLHNQAGKTISVLPHSDAGQLLQQVRAMESKVGVTPSFDEKGHQIINLLPPLGNGSSPFLQSVRQTS